MSGRSSGDTGWAWATLGIVGLVLLIAVVQLPLLFAAAHAVNRGLHYGWLRVVLVLGHFVWLVGWAEYHYVLRHEVKWAVYEDNRPGVGEPTAAMPARD